MKLAKEEGGVVVNSEGEKALEALTKGTLKTLLDLIKGSSWGETQRWLKAGESILYKFLIDAQDLGKAIGGSKKGG